MHLLDFNLNYWNIISKIRSLRFGDLRNLFRCQ